MKEFKIHKNVNGNLLSIYPIENTYSDKNYLSTIISTLFELTRGCFYLEASRPNYDINNLILQIECILDDNNNSFKHTNFEILFYAKRLDRELLDILPAIWNAHEHISLCFFVENEINLDIKRKAWTEIVNTFKSYVLFKGVEEDVVWIGKNKALTFDTIATL